MKKERLYVLDALRGLALLMIIIVHSIKHFNAPYLESGIFYIGRIDGIMKTILSTLITGKAYTVFALMFGISFFIQINNKEIQGIDFRGRFAWRLVILVVLGFFHSLIYNGDILHIYAIFGFVLVFLYKVRTSALLLFTLLLLVQIPTILEIYALGSDQSVVHHVSSNIDVQRKLYAHGTFFQVANFNVWDGRVLTWEWFEQTGRHLQIMALFLAGLLLGRVGFFKKYLDHKRTTLVIVIISFVTFVLFYLGIREIKLMNDNYYRYNLIIRLLESYNNLIFTVFLISSFILIYARYNRFYGFRLLEVYGKMSLTNFVVQGIFGVLFFYGFGLGMYYYLGTFFSLLFGLLFFAIQIYFSIKWLDRFYYGPLEWFWRAATYNDFSIKLRRPPS